MDKSIGTKIGFFQYDGGEGFHNKYEILGFCKESIEEVYSTLKDKYLIHNCEIANKDELDWSYGLTIEEFKPINIYGIENVINGELKEIIKLIDKFSKKNKSLIK